jgi:hypothetical protein
VEDTRQRFFLKKYFLCRVPYEVTRQRFF